MMLTGVVAKFSFHAGYGFIRPTQSGDPDVFVHRREMRMPVCDLRPGLKVRFNLGIDADGKSEARNVEAMR